MARLSGTVGRESLERYEERAEQLLVARDVP
jgi:hypothetical protein